MKRMQHWLVGLVVIVVVVGLLFGGLAALVGSDAGSSLLDSLPDGHEGRGERPSQLDGSAFLDGGETELGAGLRHARGGGEGQVSLTRGLLETAVNVIKIALVIAVFGVALPAFWRRRQNHRQPVGV